MSSNKDNTMPFFCFKPVRGSPLHQAMWLSLHGRTLLVEWEAEGGTFGRAAQSPLEIFHLVVLYSSSGCGEERRGAGKARRVTELGSRQEPE